MPGSSTYRRPFSDAQVLAHCPTCSSNVATQVTVSCEQIAVMDQRCAHISKRRRTSTGAFSCFDPVLRERFLTLNKTSIGTIYILLDVALRLEYGGDDARTMQARLAAVQAMGPKEKNVKILTRSKALVRKVRGWHDLGPVKVRILTLVCGTQNK